MSDAPPLVTVTLHGAASGTVTGSAYQVTTPQANILVDFGLYQGAEDEDRNVVPRRVDVPSLKAVLLTHAHLDHTGRLPLLARRGFAGPIYATTATIELTDLILRDAAKVQAQDVARVNRKRQRADKPPIEPLFTLEDVQAITARCRPVAYHEPVEVAPGMRARFFEAGHILGSASIELAAGDAGRKRLLVFSGDLGPRGAPILRDYECLERGNLVFLESTYGDRDHKPFKETFAELASILQRAVEQKGRVLVPTFAIGRAQVLLQLVAVLFRRGMVPKFPVFLDSPMAIEATAILRRHPELFDAELSALIQEHPLERDLDTLTATVTADQSKQLNDLPGPLLVLAGAGMCTGGRIIHHLRQHLWKPDTHVLIVGFQAEGSLGRQLVDGKKLVRIFGEEVAVKATVHSLGGLSAHAGQSDLLNWFNCLARARPRTVLTHGEDRARRPLADLIRSRFLLGAELGSLGEEIELH